MTHEWKIEYRPLVDANGIEVKDSLVEYLFDVAKSKIGSTDDELHSSVDLHNKGSDFYSVVHREYVRTPIVLALIIILAPYGSSTGAPRFRSSGNRSGGSLTSCSICFQQSNVR